MTDLKIAQYSIVLLLIITILLIFRLKYLTKKTVQSDTDAVCELDKIRKYPMDYNGIIKLLNKYEIDTREIVKLKKRIDAFYFLLGILAVCVIIQ